MLFYLLHLPCNSDLHHTFLLDQFILHSLPYLTDSDGIQISIIPAPWSVHCSDPMWSVLDCEMSFQRAAARYHGGYIWDMDLCELCATVFHLQATDTSNQFQGSSSFCTFLFNLNIGFSNSRWLCDH